jgi:hypothetical protein
MKILERSVANTFAISIYSLIMTLEGVKENYQVLQLLSTKSLYPLEKLFPDPSFPVFLPVFSRCFPNCSGYSQQFHGESFIIFIFNHFD